MPLMLLIIALQVVLFACFALMPFQVRRGVCFGVSIPADHFDLPALRAQRNRYALFTGITCLITAIPPVAVIASGAGDLTVMWVYLACMALTLICLFLLYLFAHRAVKRIKKQENWALNRPQIVAAPATPGRAMPSLAWVVLPMLLMTCLSLMIGYALYPGLSGPVAIHWNMWMQADGYMEKGPGLIWMLPLIQLMLTAVFALVGTTILKTRRRLEAADPADSLRRNDTFRRAWFWFTLIMGNLLVAGMSLLQASIFQALPVAVSMGFLCVAAAFAILGALALSILVGQGGSRLPGKSGKAAAVDLDDDRHWKLGSIYYNPDDPAIFVEKRFGIGFTNNFARPMTWVIIGAFILVILGICAATLVLTL